MSSNDNELYAAEIRLAKLRIESYRDAKKLAEYKSQLAMFSKIVSGEKDVSGQSK